MIRVETLETGDKYRDDLRFQRRAHNTILFNMETGKCKAAAAIAITLTLMICPLVIT